MHARGSRFISRETQEALEEAHAAARETAQKVLAAAKENGGTVYVRWTKDPKRDTKPGAVSYNHLTGQAEPGLSVMPIRVGMDEVEIASTIVSYAYGYLVEGLPHKAFIFKGDLVGEGSDGEPVIRNQKVLGYVDLERLNTLLRGKLALQAEENIKFAESQIERSMKVLADNGLTPESAEARIQEYEAKEKAWVDAKNPTSYSRATYEWEFRRLNREEENEVNAIKGALKNIQHYENVTKEPLRDLEFFMQNLGRKEFSKRDVQAMRRKYGEADFSIAGMKARGASEYIGRGDDYIDKADGQRKFVIPNTAGGARAKAVSYTLAATTNLLDFLLRVTRAADERL